MKSLISPGRYITTISLQTLNLKDQTLIHTKSNRVHKKQHTVHPNRSYDYSEVCSVRTGIQCFTVPVHRGMQLAARPVKQRYPDSTTSHGRRNMALVTKHNKIFIIFHASPADFLSLIKKYILRSVGYQGNWNNFCRITHAAAMLTSVYGNL